MNCQPPTRAAVNTQTEPRNVSTWCPVNACSVRVTTEPRFPGVLAERRSPMDIWAGHMRSPQGEREGPGTGICPGAIAPARIGGNQVRFLSRGAEQEAGI